MQKQSLNFSIFNSYFFSPRSPLLALCYFTRNDLGGNASNRNESSMSIFGQRSL